MVTLFALPEFAIEGMAVKGHLDGCEELPVHEGFDNIPIGGSLLCFCKPVVIDICSKVNDRDVKALLEQPGGLDPVNLPMLYP